MRRFTVVLLALTALAAASASRPAAAQPPADRVRELLSGYEHVPGASTFHALGPGTAQVLMALAEDDGERGWVRLRAVGALAWFPTPTVRAFLRRVARDRQRDPLFTRAAVLALGRGFGRDAVTELVPFLGHEKAIVRRAAARALLATRAAEAREQVRKHLSHEPSPATRRAIERWLTQPPGN